VTGTPSALQTLSSYSFHLDLLPAFTVVYTRFLFNHRSFLQSPEGRPGTHRSPKRNRWGYKELSTDQTPFLMLSKWRQRTEGVQSIKRSSCVRHRPIIDIWTCHTESTEYQITIVVFLANGNSNERNTTNALIFCLTTQLLHIKISSYGSSEKVGRCQGGEVWWSGGGGVTTENFWK